MLSTDWWMELKLSWQGKATTNKTIVFNSKRRISLSSTPAGLYCWYNFGSGLWKNREQFSCRVILFFRYNVRLFRLRVCVYPSSQISRHGVKAYAVGWILWDSAVQKRIWTETSYHCSARSFSDIVFFFSFWGFDPRDSSWKSTMNTTNSLDPWW